MTIFSVQTCYNDGVTGEVCQPAVTINYENVVLDALVYDTFNDTDGVIVTAHTPDIDVEGGGWLLAYPYDTSPEGQEVGTPEILSNTLVSKYREEEGLYTLDTEAVCSIDAGASDVLIQATIICGEGPYSPTLRGRKLDDFSGWELIIYDCDTADPVLHLVETPTYANSADLELTGLGPLEGQTIVMELELTSALLTGRAIIDATEYVVNYSSNLYLTETIHGIWVSGQGDPDIPWKVDDFAVYAAPPALLEVSAKAFGGSTNYYKRTNDVSPTLYSGLLQSDDSGDTYEDMTLVFCVYVNEYAEADIFSSDSYVFYVSCDSTDGKFIYGGDNWDATYSQLSINPSGSPSDGGIWPLGQWHAVMISLNSDATSSPELKTVTVWVDGEEKYSGTFDPGSSTSVFSPMGWAGDCFVGKGEDVYGTPGLDCYLSYVWCAETYLDPATYWSYFFNVDNKPLYIGEDGSGVTGEQPDTYCPDGDFTNNLGFVGAWEEVGTVPNAPSSPSD